MILRSILFFILLIFATATPPLIFACALFLYALRFVAYELICIGLIMDGLYATWQDHLSIPYYTILSITVLVVAEWIKPRLSVYNA